MLKEKYLNDLSAEILICKPLAKSPKVEMSVPDAEMLIKYYTMSADDAELFYEHLLKNGGYRFKVFRKRMEAIYPFDMETKAVLMVATMVDTIGQSILLLHMILYWWSKNDYPKIITADHVCQKIFPGGIPSTSTMREVWQNTKVKTDKGMIANLVDLSKYSASMFEPVADKSNQA